jgi:chromatin remodeling complex protein RSC6
LLAFIQLENFMTKCFLRAYKNGNLIQKFGLMENSNEGRNEKKFKNFGKRVDDFMLDLNEAGEKLQKEFREKFEDLKATAEKIKKESENNERWKEVEDSLRKASDELAHAFKAAFKKRDEGGSGNVGGK